MNEITLKITNKIFKKIPYVSVILSLLLIVIYFLMGSEANQYGTIPIKYVVLWGGNFSGLALGSESWRLFTSVFLHLNFIHLVMNVYSIIIVGAMLEKRIGSIWFIIYFILFGIAGSIASIIWNVYTVSAGSSGAIFGLVGLYLLISLKPSKERDIIHSSNILTVIIVNLFFGFYNNDIDNAAHIGGLVLGIIVGFLFLAPFKRNVNNVFLKKSIGLVLSILIICSTYLSISKFRAEYYDFFKFMLEKEEKALEIQDQNGSFYNPNYNSELAIANKHWQDIKDSIKNLGNINQIGIKQDTANFRIYINHHQKIIWYLQKISDQASFTYLDSVERTYQLINEMPPLNYPLNLFPKVLEKDSLKEVKIWYNKHWIKTQDSLNATYYRIAKVDSLGRFQSFLHDFYADGSIQMKGKYTNNLTNGIFYFFYPQRRYSSIGIMSNNRKVGKWQYFYKNGQLKSEIMFSERKGSEMISFWDEKGVQTVIDGNGYCNNFDEKDSIYETGPYVNHYKVGKWNGYYFDSSPYYEEIFEDGKLIEGRSVSKSGKHFFYSQIYETPQPEIGWEDYYKYIDTSLKETMSNLPQNLLGISSLRLYVDTNGTIKDITPINIIGYGIEDIIIRLVEDKPNFTVGKHKGQKKAMFTYIYVPIN